VTQPLPKILFDECIGKPHSEHLAKFVAISDDANAEVRHVLDFQPQGVLDEEWIPRIKDEGWTIITQDRSRQRGGKGAPLCRVCLASKVTHVILSRRVGERRSFDKMMTVLNLWYEIIAATSAPAGTRYVIEPLSMDTKDRCRGKLLERIPVVRTPPVVLFGPEEIIRATTASPPPAS